MYRVFFNENNGANLSDTTHSFLPALLHSQSRFNGGGGISRLKMLRPLQSEIMDSILPLSGNVGRYSNLIL